MNERLTITLFGLIGVIHLLPVIGVIGGERLAQLYDTGELGADLELLMRHRAVLFGLVALVMFAAAANPAFRWLAWVVGLVSVGSFLVLAQLYPELNDRIARVVAVDWVALVALAGLAIVLSTRAGSDAG